MCFPNHRYCSKYFAEIYRAQYRNVMLVHICGAPIHIYFFVLLFVYNTPSYITYTTNTYSTNITVQLRTHLEYNTATLHYLQILTRYFFNQYSTILIQLLYTICNATYPALFSFTFATLDFISTEQLPVYIEEKQNLKLTKRK